MFDSALLDDARAEISRIRTADIVIGIPSYRNARTIGGVVRSAVQAVLEHHPGKRVVLLNVDSNSSDGTASTFMRLRLPPEIQRFSTTYQGLTGHGSAVRAVLEVASAVQAQACMVLEAGMTELRPQDVQAMLLPVIENRAHLALPMHEWDDSDSVFEDLLIYPMVRLMYRRRARRTLTGDWALSGKLAMAYAEQDVWETDAARYGLDIWLLVMALASKVPIVQVPSCRKTMGLVFGTAAYEQRFSHTVSTLLRHLGTHQRLWRLSTPCEDLAMDGQAPAVLRSEERPRELYWRAFQQSMRHWKRTIRRILHPQNHEPLAHMQRAAPETLVFPDDLWARIVLDFGVCFNKAELDPDKVAASLATPFYARCLSFWNELDQLGMGAYESLVERQAQAFEAERSYLEERWDSYVAWVPDSPVR
jgi:glucosylglycerate synthase